MEILYCPVKEGNFGDNLNLYMWSRLIPNIAEVQPNEAVLGVGTLQGTFIPPKVTKVHVLGSGSHGETPGAWIDSNKLRIHFVRGPRTAALWKCADRSITDGAILLNQIEVPALSGNAPKGGIGFIPHHKSDRLADYKVICESAGLRHISPRTNNIEKFINEVRSCDYVISEALHGAVIADMYRVPWAAACSGPYINEFKWHDWCESIDLTYMPYRLPFICTRGIHPLTRVGNLFKRGLSGVGIGKERWRHKRVAFNDPEESENLAKTIELLKTQANWNLSADSVFSNVCERSAISWRTFEKEIGI